MDTRPLYRPYTAYYAGSTNKSPGKNDICYVQQYTTTLESIPVGPCGPEAPVFPVAPAGPVNPVTPGCPLAPVFPMTPASPGKPVAPTSPVGPAGPLLPLGPMTPAQDNTLQLVYASTYSNTLHFCLLAFFS